MDPTTPPPCPVPLHELPRFLRNASLFAVCVAGITCIGFGALAVAYTVPKTIAALLTSGTILENPVVDLASLVAPPLGYALLALAGRVDRRADRTRCRWCGYDVTAHPAGTNCPECGIVVDRVT